MLVVVSVAVAVVVDIVVTCNPFFFPTDVKHTPVYDAGCFFLFIVGDIQAIAWVPYSSRVNSSRTAPTCWVTNYL